VADADADDDILDDVDDGRAMDGVANRGVSHFSFWKRRF
jgi:hypothetical protein